MTGQVIFSHYGNQRAQRWPFLGSILGVHGLDFDHLRQVLRVQGLYGTIFGPLWGVHRLVLDHIRPIIGVQQLELGHFGHYGGQSLDLSYVFDHLLGQRAFCAHYEGLRDSDSNDFAFMQCIIL